MRPRGLILLLIAALVVQSCWAVGEWLHTHGPNQSNLTAASLNADPHHEGLHDDSRPQAPDAERDHHHSCFAHSPFALTAEWVTTAVTTESFTQPGPIPRLSEAPSESIDRPNWRSPA